jgi:hypothetical protein
VSLGRFLTSSVVADIVECFVLYVLVRGALEVLTDFVDRSIIF